MNAQTKKLLLDVVEAGRSVVTRCGGHTFTEYVADRWFRRTVEREGTNMGTLVAQVAWRQESAMAATNVPTCAQEGNRYRFWAEIEELEGRFLRVVMLQDKVTVHDAFPDRRFKP